MELSFGIVSIFSITAALIGTYLLPTAVRRSLTFEYTDPTLATAYTAHFVHFTPSHLFENLLAFVLASSVIVFLASRSNDRWFLIGFFTTLLFVLPLVLSFLNLAVPRDSVTYGFSGLNMALVGFLPIALLRYVEYGRRDRMQPGVLPASFFVSALYISIVAVPPSQLSKVAFVTSTALGAVFTIRSGRSNPFRLGSLSERLRLIDPVVIVAGGVWVALLSAGFPDIVARDGSVINIYAHFVGYALSFMVAYLAHEWRLLGSEPGRELADRLRGL